MPPAPPFDAKSAARKLLREARSGALATLSPPRQDPYCSLVNVATMADGAPLLLLSRLALHTRNLLHDPRVSLLLDERKEGDPLEGARVMLQGTVASTVDASARRRYLARQPEAEMFVDFADFGFYRMTLRARTWWPGLAASLTYRQRTFSPRSRTRPLSLTLSLRSSRILMKTTPTQYGSMRGRCGMLRTDRGAASAAIPTASNCNSAARRCG